MVTGGRPTLVGDRGRADGSINSVAHVKLTRFGYPAGTLEFFL